MKREKMLSCLSAAVIAFCLGFGSVSCMVTGFGLPVSWLWLAVGCGLGAILAALCFSVKRGGVILSGLALVHGLMMLLSENFWQQLKALCFRAFYNYNRGYGVPIPEWMNGQTADSHLLPLLLIAGLAMTAAAWTVLRPRRAFWAVGAALLPLATCLVVTNTVPSLFAVFFLLFGLVLLVMTQSVRRQDAAQGNRLTGILLLPVAGLLLALFFAVPQGDYNAPAQTGSVTALFDWLLSRLPFVGQTSEGELVVSLGSTITDEVDLSRMGQRHLRAVPVMEVTADFSGDLYLRGKDYDVYDGLAWSATENRTEEGFGPAEIWTQDDGALAVRTMGRRGQFYIPYYPGSQQILEGGAVTNPGYQMEYSYHCRSLRDNWQQLWRAWQWGDISELPVETAADERYLALPEQTRQGAEEILEQIFDSDGEISATRFYDAAQKAELIGEYVRSSADYDLNTGRMPEGEEDFALWFLENGETGYCVHFASAAAVLLRAAGIPARYVEGYSVSVRAGETAVVREQAAHAWVEYYLDCVGWVVLDPTPGAAEEEEDPSEVTTEPETTEPATEGETHPQESTGAATQPTGGGADGTTAPSSDSPGAQRTLPRWFVTLLRWLAGIAVAALLAVGQWGLRRYGKLRRMYRGKANAQALARFREVRLIARLWKIPVPDELQNLAEKAKFSQHTLTKEELFRFDSFLREGVAELRDRLWYYKIVCRLIFAAY